MFHHLVQVGDGLRMRLKRIELLNCDAALPAVQLSLVDARMTRLRQRFTRPFAETAVGARDPRLPLHRAGHGGALRYRGAHVDVAQAAPEIERLARWPTHARAYGHGHRVGLMLENRPAFFFHWLALNALGVRWCRSTPSGAARSSSTSIGHAEIGLAVVPAERELPT